MTKTKKKLDITKRQKELVDELVSTAKTHGVSEEYGNGSGVDADKKNCDDQRAALEKELARLNRSIKTLNLKNKELGQENRSLKKNQAL